jgi:hypothetical protein
MAPETIVLDRIAEAFDHLPKLTAEERALIFAAIDQPSNREAWVKAKEIDLASGALLTPFTFAEAVRWVPWPSDAQMLAGLNYAAGFVAA